MLWAEVDPIEFSISGRRRCRVQVSLAGESSAARTDHRGRRHQAVEMMPAITPREVKPDKVVDVRTNNGQVLGQDRPGGHVVIVEV